MRVHASSCGLVTTNAFEVADFVAFLKKKTTTKSSLKSREFGFAKGKIILSDDFDAPLEDFKEYT